MQEERVKGKEALNEALEVSQIVPHSTSLALRLTKNTGKVNDCFFFKSMFKLFFKITKFLFFKTGRKATKFGSYRNSEKRGKEEI